MGRLNLLTLLFLAGLTVSCQTTLSRRDAALVYYNTGNAFFELGQPDKAAEYYRKAISLDRTIREPSYNLVRAFIEMSMYAEGAEILDDMLKTDPENTLLLETFGYLHYKKGEYPQAREYFDRVLQLDPGDQSALLNAGIIAENQEEYAQAYDYYIRLYTLKPEGVVVKRLGILAGRLDRKEDQKLYLEAYVLKNPSDRETLLLIRDMYLAEQNYKPALDKTEQLVLSSPEEKKALHLFEKGRILIVFMLDFEKGLEAVSQALEAGFSDREAARALVREADPQASGSLSELFRKKGLYP